MRVARCGRMRRKRAAQPRRRTRHHARARRSVRHRLSGELFNTKRRAQQYARQHFGYKQLDIGAKRRTRRSRRFNILRSSTYINVHQHAYRRTRYALLSYCQVDTNTLFLQIMYPFRCKESIEFALECYWLLEAYGVEHYIRDHKHAQGFFLREEIFNDYIRSKNHLAAVRPTKSASTASLHHCTQAEGRTFIRQQKQ